MSAFAVFQEAITEKRKELRKIIDAKILFGMSEEEYYSLTNNQDDDADEFPKRIKGLHDHIINTNKNKYGMAKVKAVVGNKIMVDPVKQGETETEGGLILPESVKQTNVNGVVIAVGPDADSRIKEGTKVMYDPKTGAEVKTDKKTYLIFRDIDILFFLADAE